MGVQTTYRLTKKQIIMLAILIAGAFVTVLNQTLLSPALPSIMNELHITATEGQWLTTAFMLVNGIMIPITAYLISKFSTRFLFTLSMGVFTLGTVLAAIAMNFHLLLIGRILQAMGAGVMMPMAQTIMLLMIPRNQRGAAMGLVGLVIGFAPAIGPTLAGLIVDRYNWHMLFYIIAPLALLIVILAYFTLENVGETTDPDLDMLSVILSTLGFGGLLYSLSAIGSSGFHAITMITLIIGIVALIWFFRRQLSLAVPLLEIRVLANKTFLYSTIITMVINAALIVGGIITPIYIQNIRGFSAFVSGIMMLPGAILMGIMSPITGRMFDKIGPRKLALSGLAILTVGTCFLAVMGENTSIYWLTFVYTFRMFGMSMVNMPLNTWGLNALENKLLPHGTAVGNTFRQVAGSLGTAVLVTVMTITIAFAPDPASVQANIHGINMAFACAAAIAGAAFVMSWFVVKD